MMTYAAMKKNKSEICQGHQEPRFKAPSKLIYQYWIKMSPTESAEKII